ncbi:Uma2 family endonuclease [Cohnella massiliensis]|uniref:Uma2 family endonuclease n=1 Tax=Cohnella massiliensis TaxID=1816691 RepID=UPI0009BAB151|nr:Uma2 family endonuclease [Cohnella massiliensis]
MEDNNREKKPDNGTIRERQSVYDTFDRVEIIDGVAYEMKPSPKLSHQALLQNLFTQLNATCQPDGIIVFAPMDVHFDENNVVQPDLIFIRYDNSGIIVNERIVGAPDLLAEILSPGTASRDRIVKKALYERFGVKEYWVADPVHAIVDRFVLNDGKLVLAETYGEGDTITSDLLPCVSIGMDELFAPLARFRADE